MSLVIDGPQGTNYSKRVNLTALGKHLLVRRVKHQDDLEVDIEQSGELFQPIVDEEAKKQAEATPSE